MRVAVVASSMAALGLSYAPERFSPKYVPVDEESIRCRPCDPYALAKVCDEAMGSMFARRAGMAVLAFRFPYTVAGEEIACRAAAMASDWAMGERELWAYLDVRVRLGPWSWDCEQGYQERCRGSRFSTSSLTTR